MKPIVIAAITLLFASCGSNEHTIRYIKVAESSGIEPKFSEKYQTMKNEIIVLLDSKTNEFIYYSVWDEKVINRVKLK